MRRRRDASVPHREFFRAVVIGETVTLACTCPRGEDHWFEPGEENPSDPRIGARLRAKRSTADETALAGTMKLRNPHPADGGIGAGSSEA
ncbi:MAG TPA: hypothetical protein VIX39_09155 [Actinomycetota bacterium]